MKKMLVVSALAFLGFSTNVLADNLSTSPSGFYLGISGGLGFTNYDNMQFSYRDENFKIHKDNHFVSRIFAGYDINRYFAVEIGYTDFWGKVSGQYNDYACGDRNAASGWPCKMSTDYKFKMVQAFDLFGKFKAPILDNVSFYGKLGINFLFGNAVDKDKERVTFKSQTDCNIAFGFGMDFALTTNLVLNAEWLRFNGNHEIESYQPYADALMVGLRYKF